MLGTPSSDKPIVMWNLVTDKIVGYWEVDGK